MPMPKDEMQQEILESWRTYLNGLENSLNWLDGQIREASEMAGTCTDEWCEATEHVIDDLNNALFSISEPRTDDPELSLKIKKLRRRIYDLYVNYKGIYEKAS